METENKEKEEVSEGEEIRMSNFSMVIAVIFVTIVMIFLYVKIMFD
jgi:hypothetical protein